MINEEKAKEIVLASVKRIVKVEDAENWLQHNLTAYRLAMDVAQRKDERKDNPLCNKYYSGMKKANIDEPFLSQGGTRRPLRDDVSRQGATGVGHSADTSDVQSCE